MGVEPLTQLSGLYFGQIEKIIPVPPVKKSMASYNAAPINILYIYTLHYLKPKEKCKSNCFYFGAVQIVQTIHCKAGEANTSLKTASCEVGPGTTRMYSL